MRRTLKAYWMLYKINLMNTFSEKGKIFLWSITGAVETFVLAFPWLMLSYIKGDVGGVSTKTIAMYYIITTMMWYVCGGVFGSGFSKIIKNGRLSVNLTKPIFPFASIIIGEQSWKTVSLFYSLGMHILLIAVTVGFSPDLINFNLVPIWLLFLPGAALIFAEIEVFKGLTSFWMQKYYGFANTIDLFRMIFGGAAAPLYLLPLWLQVVSRYMPFQYIFGFPTTVLQGNVTGGEITNGLLFTYGWVTILFVLCFVLYKFGLKRYEANGS